MCRMTDIDERSSAAEPRAGGGWLRELKHDGHRLVAIFDGRGGLRLVSRNGQTMTTMISVAVDQSRDDKSSLASSINLATPRVKSR
jgi:ATP-dependent DNA ligase